MRSTETNMSRKRPQDLGYNDNMFLRALLFGVLVALFSPVTAFSFQGYVQSFDQDGTITWGNGEITVSKVMTNTDAPQSEHLMAYEVRKAATQARKQMLDMIMSTRIDAKRTVSGFLADNTELAARVRGLVQNSRFERPAVFDGEGTVRVFESFRGKLAELVLPTTIPFQSGIPPRLSTSMEQSMTYTQGVPEQAGAGYGYTGVIIDARGYQVTPALAPVIYGQDGVGAYGAFQVSRASAVSKGIVAYSNVADKGALRSRVGDRPLVVRALNSYGSWRTDLIISTPMAQLVRKVMSGGLPAQGCRVVIAIDPPKPMDADTDKSNEVPAETVPEQSKEEQ
jgi:hypothetical protein